MMMHLWLLPPKTLTCHKPAALRLHLTRHTLLLPCAWDLTSPNPLHAHCTAPHAAACRSRRPARLPSPVGSLDGPGCTCMVQKPGGELLGCEGKAAALVPQDLGSAHLTVGAGACKRAFAGVRGVLGCWAAKLSSIPTRVLHKRGEGGLATQPRPTHHTPSQYKSPSCAPCYATLHQLALLKQLFTE